MARPRCDPLARRCDRDCWGQFCYVRDLTDGRTGRSAINRWAGPQMNPDSSFMLTEPSSVAGMATSRPAWSVCVAPDADAEVRAVTLVNHGSQPRELELTSYSEVCLNHRRADQAHPAFAKLFLETEFDPSSGALLARRRPRGANEKPIWAVHALGDRHIGARSIEYETDRVRFLGRGRTPGATRRLRPGGVAPVRTTGPVLDPIFSLRPARPLEPGSQPHRVRDRSGRHAGNGDRHRRTNSATIEAIDRAFAGAKAGCQNELRSVVFDTGRRRPVQPPGCGRHFHNSRAPQTSMRWPPNRLGQSGLWPHSISGDLPIVLVRVARRPRTRRWFAKSFSGSVYHAAADWRWTSSFWTSVPVNLPIGYEANCRRKCRRDARQAGRGFPLTTDKVLGR